jgi:hypothetical protein
MMNRHHFPRPAVAFLLAALTYGSTLGPGAAQETKSKPPPPEPSKPAATELQVFHLRFAAAGELISVLGSIRELMETGMSLGADVRANAIIVSGRPAEIAKVKDLIAKLDTEQPGNRPSPARMNIFHLKHIEPDQYLEEALKLTQQNGNGFSFAVDRPRKSVLVAGDQAAIDAAASLLASLDTPVARTQDVQLRIVWLVSGGEAPAPPDDLKDVLPALAKLGIDKPRLAAQTVVNTKPGAEFHAQGVTKIGATYQFMASGRLTDRPDAPDLQIHLQAIESGNPGAQQICSLQTQIAAPPGHLVVLGVTPTGSMTSVFVVQVLRPNAPKPVPQK